MRLSTLRPVWQVQGCAKVGGKDLCTRVRRPKVGKRLRRDGAIVLHVKEPRLGKFQGLVLPDSRDLDFRVRVDGALAHVDFRRNKNETGADLLTLLRDPATALTSRTLSEKRPQGQNAQLRLRYNGSHFALFPLGASLHRTQRAEHGAPATPLRRRGNPALISTACKLHVCRCF